MAAFFFQLSLPQYAEILATAVEEQKQHIDRLASEGRLLSYSVAALKNFIWCIIRAEDETEASGYIADFPLFSFFSDVQCHLLLYHHEFSASMPDISMN